MVLDKNVTKYVYLGGEKFKASFSQSKTSGQIYFDVSINASTTEELKINSKDAIDVCATICNTFNEALQTDTTSKKGGKNKKISPPTTPSEKNKKTKNVKGLK